MPLFPPPNPLGSPCAGCVPLRCSSGVGGGVDEADEAAEAPVRGYGSALRRAVSNVLGEDLVVDSPPPTSFRPLGGRETPFPSFSPLPRVGEGGPAFGGDAFEIGGDDVSTVLDEDSDDDRAVSSPPALRRLASLGFETVCYSMGAYMLRLGRLLYARQRDLACYMSALMDPRSSTDSCFPSAYLAPVPGSVCPAVYRDDVERMHILSIGLQIATDDLMEYALVTSRYYEEFFRVTSPDGFADDYTARTSDDSDMSDNSSASSLYVSCDFFGTARVMSAEADLWLDGANSRSPLTLFKMVRDCRRRLLAEAEHRGDDALFDVVVGITNRLGSECLRYSKGEGANPVDAAYDSETMSWRNVFIGDFGTDPLLDETCVGGPEGHVFEGGDPVFERPVPPAPPAAPVRQRSRGVVRDNISPLTLPGVDPRATPDGVRHATIRRRLASAFDDANDGGGSEDACVGGDASVSVCASCGHEVVAEEDKENLESAMALLRLAGVED